MSGGGGRLGVLGKPRIRLARGGVLAVAAGLTITVVGALADQPIIMLWGQVMLGVVVLSYPLCLRDAVRVRDGALTVKCGTPSGPGGGIIAGVSFDLPLTVTNRSPVAFPRLALEPLTSSAIEVEAPNSARFLDTGYELRWPVDARALRVGPASVYGVHLRILGPAALFGLTVYVPLDVSMSVLPRTASARSRAPRLLTHVSERNAMSPTAQPMRGPGSDVRELRDHQAGDPFKHIAWKATARARRLIVREFESEVNLSVYVLLDISPSMRWGPRGKTRLDSAVDLTFHLSRAVKTGRDRFGLLTFDQEIFGFTRASAGLRMPQEIIAHLLELHAVVHESFTDMPTDELVVRVAEFVEAQEGVDLRLPAVSGIADATGATGPYDEAAVLGHARAYLQDHESELSVLSRYYFSAPASDPDAAALRTYCRLRGIELPYRTDAVPAPKEAGIARALRKTIPDRGGPHTFVVITDLVGIRDAEALIPAVRLARAHRNRILFVTPDAPEVPADAAPENALAKRLRTVFSEDHAGRRATIAAKLRAQGVVVYTASQLLGGLKGVSRLRGVA